MTIPGTGSRKIEVGGQQYRWTIRGRPTYSQALAESGLSVAVESIEPGGQTLHLTLPRARPDNWLGHPRYVVTPSDVARWIPAALARGWSPTRPGPTFEVTLTERDLDADRLESDPVG